MNTILNFKVHYIFKFFQLLLLSNNFDKRSGNSIADTVHDFNLEIEKPFGKILVLSFFCNLLQNWKNTVIW